MNRGNPEGNEEDSEPADLESFIDDIRDITDFSGLKLNVLKKGFSRIKNIDDLQYYEGLF